MNLPEQQPPQTPPPVLDLRKPLFDSMGNSHVIGHYTHAQVLTLSRGFMFIWDKKSGECMVKGLGTLRLMNDRVPKRRAHERVTPIDRAEMPQAANVIDCIRTSSKASSREAAARAAAMAPMGDASTGEGT